PSKPALPGGRGDQVGGYQGRGSGLGVYRESVVLPNHPVERTAHSAGSVLMRGSVPVGRRSPGALGVESTRRGKEKNRRALRTLCSVLAALTNGWDSALIQTL